MLQIILVEDDDADAALIVRALDRQGVIANVTRVRSAEELRTALARHRPNVILSDHSLPKFSGREALHMVRAAAPELPFIVVTGSLSDEMAADYIKAGASDYLVKDRLERLGPAIRQTLENADSKWRLREAERDVARSERRFRKLVEYSSDVITLLDARGSIVYSTQALKATLGYELMEMAGTSVFDLVHPGDGEQTHGLLRAVLAGRGVPARAELRVRHKNGSYRNLDVVATNHLDDAEVASIVVNYHDVTERNAAAAEVRRLQAQYLQAQKMEAVGRLAGGVAHDFNNILMAVGATCALMIEDAPEGDVRRDLTEIMKGVNRGAALTHQLLAFSRQQVVAPKALDLNALLDGMHVMLRRLMHADIAFTIEPSPGLGVVRGDHGQLEQVVANLVLNACDAMPRGGSLRISTFNMTLTVESGLDWPGALGGDYVGMAVRDSGGGMTEEVKAHLFEPFFTTKEPSKGTGLGLAIVYGIVTQNGGHIRVESEPGGGTTFTVLLPRVSDALAAPSAPAIARTVVTGTETILLVEDEAEIRAVLLRALKRNGYTVIVAADAGAAAEVSETHAGTIDLLITDLVMPGASGVEVATALRRRRPATAVLFMSGYTHDEAMKRGVIETGSEFLQKPFSLEELAHAVRRALSAP